MVYFKEFVERTRKHLALVDREDDPPKSGTCLVVRQSLLRPVTRVELPTPENFLSQMSKEIELSNMGGAKSFVLRSTMPDRPATSDKPPLLGRSIVSGNAKWKTNTVKFVGDYYYIPGYWEWTEDVLSRFGDALEHSSIFDAVYASLYSYDRDINILRAFCESWCSSTNTLHTMSGELSISLWDLFRLGGLPISGQLYDETVPDIQTLRAKNNKGERRISKACEFLLSVYRHISQRPESKKGVTARQWVEFWCKQKITYNTPVKRRRYTEVPPKSTHNPSGTLRDPPVGWSDSELAMFNFVGVDGDVRRETTYIAAFLSCWICVFVLPENEDRLIRPGTFEIAVLMARGETFSLALPVLASIYRGLNTISDSSNPSYSGAYFPAHYLYGWLAHYFAVNHVVDPSPRGPMMVCFSGAQGSKVFKDIDARCLIHEGSAAKVGCTIMNKNKNVMLFDDGNLNRKEFSYLISLRSGYLPVRRADDFYIEPYLPHRFSRQFGFCQDIPSALARAVSDRKVSYNHALRHWRLLLFQGSNSRVCAPYLSLDVHQLRTPKFYDWWNSVSISDLRHYIGKLCLSAESDSSKSKKRKSHHEVGGDHRIDGHTSQNEGTGESIMRRDSSTKVGGRKGNEDKNTSDAESESDVDFKHQRRRTGHEVVDLGDDKSDYANALDNVSIPSNIPDDVGQVRFPTLFLFYFVPLFFLTNEFVIHFPPFFF